MSSELLLGIDIGSTTVKATLLDAGADARVIASYSKPYPSAHPQPGWVEQDPEDWWSSVRAVLAAFGEQLERVSAVGITGQGSTAVLLDDAGDVLAPAISWQDQRAAPVASEIADRLDAALRRAHGNGTGDGPEPRMVWTRSERPELFARVARAVSVAGYVGYRLTGRIAVSEGDAGSWLSWNRHTHRWDDEIAGALGVSGILPEVVRAGEAIGRICAEAHRESGLPESAVVIATTTDLAAAAVSTGAAGLDDIHYSKGTGGFVTAQLHEPPDHPPFVVLPFGKEDLSQYCAGTPALGSALEWCARLIGSPDAGRAVELAETSAPGAGGVIALPWLQGSSFPVVDASARGAFLGLSLSTGPGDIARAVLEASSLEFSAQVAQLAPLLDRPLARVVCSGGPTRSPFWNLLDASALGMPVHVAKKATAAVGAALIAGEGTGLWDDANLVGRAMSGPLLRVDPDAALSDGFARRRRLLGDISAALRPLAPAIADVGRADPAGPARA
ncbi:MAG TPA: FGGY family carbohydrate kinase [Pseudolysinimonas sp.]|nr:FGGY family carbohydrate kinase [Pseudolysinimonas sp.]